MEEADAAGDVVFAENYNELVSDGRIGRRALGDQILEYPDIDVTGLFMSGVFLEFLEGRPPLPTQPRDRAFMHLLGFFCRGGSSPEEARRRVQAIYLMPEDGRPVCRHIVQFGRDAYRTRDTHYLIDSHRAAAIFSLKSVSD